MSTSFTALRDCRKWGINNHSVRECIHSSKSLFRFKLTRRIISLKHERVLDQKSYFDTTTLHHLVKASKPSSARFKNLRYKYNRLNKIPGTLNLLKLWGENDNNATNSRRRHTFKRWNLNRKTKEELIDKRPKPRRNNH